MTKITTFVFIYIKNYKKEIKNGKEKQKTDIFFDIPVDFSHKIVYNPSGSAFGSKK